MSYEATEAAEGRWMDRTPDFNTAHFSSLP